VNALGLLLLGSIVHATVFAIVGSGAYLAIRRWGPAAGSLAAGSSLGMMVLVSIIVLSPWPRWWTLRIDRPAVVADKVPRAAAHSEAPAESPAVPGEAGMTRKVVPILRIEPVSAQPNFLGILLDELRRSSNPRGSGAWTWREWLAAGFLVSVVLGLARLGIGLWEIARLRARSRPVDDPELDDMLQLLRAELSCMRRVAVREAAELTTPATIGWRRPVLLLPADWRGWDADERRAVLAHELAHVRRRDFPAGVAAQLALALHFYHPLAHWLAARLRLEQELAADAWGARLSGGKPSYLATLAQMALRRDGRALTWPARAFLPSHGTFVRRIEMLKHHGPIRHVTLPLAARVLTVSALAAIGLLVAGLRGPAGGSPALAQDRPIEQPAAGGGTDSYNLAFLPADARMIAAVRPQSLLRRRDVMSLVNSLREGPLRVDRLPVPPEDIEQVVVFWEATQADSAPRGPSPVPAPSGVVVRMAKPQDWKALLNKLAGPRLEELRHDGQVYYRFEAGSPDAKGVFTPDDRTIVVAEEVVLRDLIADRNAPAPRYPWDEAWKRVNKGQVMLALDTRWLRRRLAQAAGPGHAPGAMLTLETFAPLYEKAQSYAASLHASDRSLAVDLVAVAGSAENARPVAETLQAILTLGKNAMQGLRREVDRLRRGDVASDWILQAADSALEKARVETTEGFVRLHAESPVDLAEGIRLLAPAVTSARATARRAMSTNNLKQIGLAFHNYLSSANRFPAAVNRGGKDKSIPYSWRVAILPYIEQQELYNQYNFDEPWDGPNNRKLIDKMPAIYAYPGPDGKPSSRSNTSYFVFTGPSTAVGAGDESLISRITDGTSNTILVVEANREIPWTKPEDIPFNPNAPLPDLGGFTPDGFDAGFADGSVRYIKKSINPVTLKALITRDGGEVISTDSY
jgi:hypothetical protein